MKKQIIEFMPFYIGCKAFVVESTPNIVRNNSIKQGDIITIDGWLIGYLSRGFLKQKEPIIKPILRLLSDMTKEEGYKLVRGSKYGPYSADEVRCLCKAGFDLFKLIEKDIAMNANTIDQIKNAHDFQPKTI